MLELYFVYNGHCKFYLGRLTMSMISLSRWKTINGRSLVSPDQNLKNISEKTMYVLIMVR